MRPSEIGVNKQDDILGPVHAVQFETGMLQDRGVILMRDSSHFDGLNPKSSAWKTVLASIRSIIGTN